MKPEKRAEARKLRTEQGLALGVIAGELGVSKASVSLWVRDIELTPEQQAALLAQNPVRNGQLLGMRVRRERCREQRIAAQKHGRELARRRDADFLAGCMLYWAEGSKARNVAQLVNADADLLATFLAVLRPCRMMRRPIGQLLPRQRPQPPGDPALVARPPAAPERLPPQGDRQPTVIGLKAA